MSMICSYHSRHIRNWSITTAHYVIILVEMTIYKKTALGSFVSNPIGMKFGRKYASIDRVRFSICCYTTFKMAAMTLFNATSAAIWWVHTQRPPGQRCCVCSLHFCLEFLIHNTFVLVIMSPCLFAYFCFNDCYQILQWIKLIIISSRA